jgi:hypothetical protein
MLELKIALVLASLVAFLLAGNYAPSKFALILFAVSIALAVCALCQ